ncbi:hypothetical protein IQ267_07465 [filamentous cyanobacterium LEGE 07170]|nr:hypothetical protein [filamentous cyanobacterium LEGE 07170]
MAPLHWAGELDLDWEMDHSAGTQETVQALEEGRQQVVRPVGVRRQAVA